MVLPWFKTLGAIHKVSTQVGGGDIAKSVRVRTGGGGVNVDEYVRGSTISSHIKAILT